MASLSYATTSSGVIAGGLGWINFGTFSLAPGASVTGITATLRDGSVLRFDISNTAVTAGGATVVANTVPTFGGAPFGTAGYTGVAGNVALWTTANTASTRITLSNITVTDPFGIPVANYTIYVGDGEATGSNESISSTTNGGVWSLLTKVGTGASPTLSGIGTQTVSFTGSGNSYNAPICGTVNPTTVSSTLTEVSISGRSAIVLGISVNKISLNKIIANRFTFSDQFDLSITGASSASTTTFGSTNGAQPVIAYVYPVTLGNYVLNEVMAPGSINSLSQYKTSIAYTNLTPGGTTIPTSKSIPGTVNLNLADMIVATITNSIVPITSTKTVDKTIANVGDVLTYNVALKNVGTASVTSIIFRDTIPNGTSFKTGTVFLDNVNYPALNPTGITFVAPQVPMAPGQIVTVTFQVTITTIPTPNPIPNSAVTTCAIAAITTPDVVLSNIAYTDVLLPTITKAVEEKFSSINSTLKYTIVYKNTSTVTASNIVFLDTVPTGTTFVAGSLTENNIPTSGSPNPPGYTLQTQVGPNSSVTITFNVTTASTITTNPVKNSATINALYTAPDGTTAVNGISSAYATTTIVAGILSSSKTVSTAYANIGYVLTYTIPISNSGNTTVSNIVFLDTIPNGTSLVSGSYKQDGIAVSGTPNTATTLPNSIKAGGTSTVTFQVLIITIPVPNPIPNTASANGSFTIDLTTTQNKIGATSTNTNIVNTQVNYANLGSIVKYVDKSFATCGEVITYTIVAPNTGNVTALNVVFKDTIPNGTVLVANSVTVNGSTQTGANPNTGVTIPNIAQGATATLTFSVKVQC